MADPVSLAKPALLFAVAKATAQGNELLPQMLLHVRAAPTGECALLLAEVHFGMQRLYEAFEKDPRDVLVVRDFIEYYAPNAVKIAGVYVGQLSQTPNSPECAESHKTLLELRRVLVEEFMSKCLENDAQDALVQAVTVNRVIHVEHGQSQ